MSVGHVARYVLAISLYYSGVVLLARSVRRWAGRPHVLILAYHSFARQLPYLDLDVPPEIMTRQVEYLRRHFRMLTLSQLLAEEREPNRSFGDTTVITVDDGYADNFEPLLEAARNASVPSTLFLTTDCIDRGEPTTVMWIILAVHHASVAEIEVPELGILPLPIRTSAEKEAAILAIDIAIKPLPAAPRRAAIESLVLRSGAADAVRERARSVMLDWTQVRTLQNAGVEIGAHSLTHPVLRGLTDDEARHEIVGSVNRVREVTGQRSIPFAYPYGSDEEVGATVRELCRASGASSSVMLCDGAMPGTDHFAIPRSLVRADRATNPLGGFSKAVWACELEGLIDQARRILTSPRRWITGPAAAPSLPLAGMPASAGGSPGKVVFLVDFYASQGGSEGQLLQLIEHLDHSRYTPSLAALRSSRYLEDHPPPCPVEVLDIPSLASIRSVYRMCRFAWRLRRDGCRIVHCYYNDSSMVAPPIMWMFGIKTIVSRRDMGFWQTPRTIAVTRRVAPFVSRWVANSLAVKRCVQELEHAPTGRISVIYNGYLDEGSRRAETAAAPGTAQIPERCRVIGVVANVKPIKRLDSLIEAFARIAPAHPDTVVVIVGNDYPSTSGGSMMEELRALAGRFGLADRVIFTGGVDQPAIYVRKFDIAVLCSESEGFSNSIIEYMAEGRPVICTNTGGNPELVQDGVNGYLVPVADPEALAGRIEDLLSNPSLASGMGRVGREMVLSKYSHRKMVAEHMALYDGLLDPQRVSRARLAAQ